MTTYKIEVTQEDITAGCQGDNLRCPVARAANRVFANGEPQTDNQLSKQSQLSVAVGPDTIRVFHTGKVYKLPSIVCGWIEKYDESLMTGELPEPISFEVKD